MDSPTAIRAVRLASVAVFVVLLASIVSAGLQKSIGDGFAVVMADPWGVVSILDLYVGLVFVALWIYVLEGRLSTALKWAVALFLLGNLATLVYIVLRSLRVQSLRALFLPTRAERPEGESA